MATLQSEICICVSRIKQECHFPLLFVCFLSCLSYHRVDGKHTELILLFCPLPKKLPKLTQAFVSTSVTIFTEEGWISC